MTAPRTPDELQDPQRHGLVLRLVGHVGGVPIYQPQRGAVPCCRCKAIAENLYGTHDAPLCTKCMGEIVVEWCAQHVKQVRREMGLDDAPVPVRSRLSSDVVLVLFYAFAFLCGVMVGRAL